MVVAYFLWKLTQFEDRFLEFASVQKRFQGTIIYSAALHKWQPEQLIEKVKSC
jgi:hypothetical protein